MYKTTLLISLGKKLKEAQKINTFLIVSSHLSDVPLSPLNFLHFLSNYALKLYYIHTKPSLVSMNPRILQKPQILLLY